MHCGGRNSVSCASKDLQQIRGVLHFRVRGKGEKEREVPVTTVTQRLITEYLEAAGHKEDLEGPLFRPVKNNVTGTLANPLSRQEKPRVMGRDGNL